MQFYKVDIDTPMSEVHSTEKWDGSKIQQLREKSGDVVYIDEVPLWYRGADYVWRVVDAYYTDEDSTITYFRAYDLDGKLLPEATFGVTWDGFRGTISGRFKYRPVTNQQYIPVENSFHTPNSGGYIVQVLDRDNPSERVAFGMLGGDGNPHKCLVISFRLFKMNEDYPN